MPMINNKQKFNVKPTLQEFATYLGYAQRLGSSYCYNTAEKH